MKFYQSIHPNVLKSKLNLKGIPCLVFKPNNLHSHYKTIVFYHGWHSSKEDVAFRAILISSFGYLVIVPDAIYHGERNPIDYDKEGALDLYFWKIIKHTIDESQNLLKEVKKLNIVDENNLTVAGNSMGGFIASGVFMKHQEINKLININGCSAFLYAENLFRRMENKEPLTDVEKEEMALYDLGSHLEKIEDRQILLLHGKKDETIPVDVAKYFYEKALPSYKNPNNIQLNIYHNVNHHMTTSMIEAIILFLK